MDQADKNGPKNSKALGFYSRIYVSDMMSTRKSEENNV